MKQTMQVYCGWCTREVMLDEAHHAEGLVGIFCSEACIITCLRCHPHINPFPQMNQEQMGVRDLSIPQGGAREQKQIQFDDTNLFRRYEGDWQ